MSDRRRLVDETLEQALERPPSERAAFVADTVGSDSALYEEILARLGDDGGTRVAPDRAPIEAAPGARREDRGLAVGTLLEGKYRIDALLGRGGMGDVYRATQLQLERVVAIKLIRGGADSGAALARFQREALAVARLNHPHIVGVFDLSAVEGVGSYLVMEYVEGRSLREELRARGRLAIREAVELMRQACSATDAAHRAGIVHRDLKPENIMLETTERGGEAKVLDFGVAKLEDADRLASVGLTAGGALIGTPLYMSPEQCEGAPVDARSDVYALGCVLYELVVGQPPFPARSIAEIVYKHVNVAPPPPSAANPAVGRDLEAVILRALAKRPAERFQSAAELGEALRGIDSPAEPLAPSERAGGPTAGVSHRAETLVVTEARKTVWGNLAVPVTSVVGRDSEVREVEELLERARLVTLTGPGGTGKTRLALAVAGRVKERFPGGVYFVDLAAVRDPGLVVSAIAGELGVVEAGSGSLVDGLVEFLRGREVLLVLDNFEQVVDAAAVVAGLLPAAPLLHILVTSRSLLRVRSETEFAVPPLDLPPEGGLSAEEAACYGSVALFVERAQMAKPGFALTAENTEAVCDICRRLDGLPLAVELAAARLRLMPPSALLARLADRLRLLVGGARDLPARQQTMRDTVAWSYDLLDADEKQVFERLSVFAGGCTLEAAEAVCAAEPVSDAEVLDAVASLVEKSLLGRREQADGETRFRMLEVVREFAVERLRESGWETEARRRHAATYMALAESAAPELFGARAVAWYARLEEEHDNLRAALAWLLEHDPAGCLRLAGASPNFWLARGHLTEGRRWLTAALERTGADVSPARAKALNAAGKLAWRQGDVASARDCFEEMLRIATASEDRWSLAWSSYALGTVAQHGAQWPAARAHLERSLAIGRELESSGLIAHSLVALGEIARHEGQWAQARDLYEQALAIHRAAGDQEGASTALVNLGAVALDSGDVDSASARYTEALAIDRRLGNECAISYSLDGLAAVAASRASWSRAARLAAAAEALRDAAGYELEPQDREFRERYLEAIRAGLGDAGLDAASAAGRDLTLEQTVALALDDALPADD